MLKVETAAARFSFFFQLDLARSKTARPCCKSGSAFPAQLTTGYINSYFYTGADGAMVFWCPVTGGTTPGSDFPRSELRELLVPGNEYGNWTGYGTHILNAQCKVTQT